MRKAQQALTFVAITAIVLVIIVVGFIYLNNRGPTPADSCISETGTPCPRTALFASTATDEGVVFIDFINSHDLTMIVPPQAQANFQVTSGQCQVNQILLTTPSGNFDNAITYDIESLQQIAQQNDEFDIDQIQHIELLPGQQGTIIVVCNRPDPSPELAFQYRLDYFLMGSNFMRTSLFQVSARTQTSGAPSFTPNDPTLALPVNDEDDEEPPAEPPVCTQDMTALQCMQLQCDFDFDYGGGGTNLCRCIAMDSCTCDTLLPPEQELLDVCEPDEEPTPTDTVSECMTITESGTYVLQNNIDYNGSGTCIDIRADDVTLNLAGHTIRYTGTAPFAKAIGVGFEPPTGQQVDIYYNDVHIRNGIIEDFPKGVTIHGGSNHLVRDLTITGELSSTSPISGFEGIVFYAVADSVIRNNNIVDIASDVMIMQLFAIRVTGAGGGAIPVPVPQQTSSNILIEGNLIENFQIQTTETPFIGFDETFIGLNIEGYNVEIENNTIQNISYSDAITTSSIGRGIQISGSGQLHISNNYMRDLQHAFVIDNNALGNVRIQNNQVRDVRYYGWLRHSNTIHFLNNIFSEPQNTLGFAVQECDIFLADNISILYTDSAASPLNMNAALQFKEGTCSNIHLNGIQQLGGSAGSGTTGMYVDVPVQDVIISNSTVCNEGGRTFEFRQNLDLLVFDNVTRSSCLASPDFVHMLRGVGGVAESIARNIIIRDSLLGRLQINANESVLLERTDFGNIHITRTTGPLILFQNILFNYNPTSSALFAISATEIKTSWTQPHNITFLANSGGFTNPVVMRRFPFGSAPQLCNECIVAEGSLNAPQVTIQVPGQGRYTIAEQ